VIHSSEQATGSVPVYIKKLNQVLITLQPRDYSFSMDESLDTLFGMFYRHKIGINLIQNSAVSFTIIADYREDQFEGLTNELDSDYIIRYNLGLNLITIRHYTGEAVERVIEQDKVFLEQRTRNTVHFVVKE
jgi:aspartate kinase